MPLPSFTVTGNLRDILPTPSGGDVADEAWTDAYVILASNITSGVLVWDGDIYNRPPAVKATVDTDGSIEIGNLPVELLANDPGLNVENIQWRCDIKMSSYNVVASFWFDAPEAGETVDLATVAHVPTADVQPVAGLTMSALLAALGDDASSIRASLDALYESSGGGPIDADAITDATTVGKALVRAADAAAARGAISAVDAAYVTTQVNALINSAPGTLDTLGEIATVLEAIRTGAPSAFDTLAEIAAGKQDADADLTAIAALTTTSFGRSLLTQADAAAARATLVLDNPIVLTPTGVTATDTAAMDAAVVTALADKRPIVLKAGTFQRSTPWDLRGQSLCVHGAGRENTFIKQMTANTAGIKVGHLYQNIGDFTLINNAQSPSTDTAANGMEFYKAGFSDYHRIQICLFAVGMYIPQADYNTPGLGATQNWAFSNHYDGMKVKGFSISAIKMVTFGGASTGSVWDNTYVSNDWSGITTCTEDAIRIGFVDEMVFNQLNVEWMSVPNYDVVSFVSAGPVTINAMHYEQVTMGAFGACLLRPYDSRVTVNGLSLSADTITNSGTHAVSKISTPLDGIVINGFRQHDNTVSGTWVLFNAEAGSAGAYAAATAAGVATGTNLFSAVRVEAASPPTVKQINDIYYTMELGAASDTTLSRSAAGVLAVEGKDLAFKDATINAQTGTTYTLVVADDGKVVTLSNAAAITVTVPQDSAAAIPIGAYIEFVQLGAGQVTFAAGTGATLNSRGGALKINGQYGVAGLRKTAANTFVLAGDTTT